MSCLRYLCLFVGDLMSCLRYLCLFVGGLMSCLRYLCLLVGELISCLRYLCLFVRGIMSCLRYLCLFVNSGVQHIFCCVFLRFCVPCVGSFSGLSIFDSPSVFRKVIIEKFLIRLTDI